MTMQNGIMASRTTGRHRRVRKPRSTSGRRPWLVLARAIVSQVRCGGAMGLARCNAVVESARRRHGSAQVGGSLAQRRQEASWRHEGRCHHAGRTGGCPRAVQVSRRSCRRGSCPLTRGARRTSLRPRRTYAVFEIFGTLPENIPVFHSSSRKSGANISKHIVRLQPHSGQTV